MIDVRCERCGIEREIDKRDIVMRTDEPGKMNIPVPIGWEWQMKAREPHRGGEFELLCGKCKANEKGE